MSLVAAVAQLSSLVRWLDFRLASNRFIAGATVLTSSLAFAYRLYEGASAIDAGLYGGRFGAGVFLSWALARELDPDHAASAGVAAAASVAFLLTGPPDLVALVVLLAATRIVSRSTGKPPTVFDAVFLTALAVLCVTRSTGVPAAGALAAALLADRRLPKPEGARSGAWSVVVALSATAGAGHLGTLTPSWNPPTGIELAGLVLVAIALLTLRAPPPTSMDDRRRPLDGRRVTAATVLAAGAGAVTVALVGGAAFAALSPLWAAVVGVVAYRRGPFRKPGPEPAV
jgi:hypothetical protein